MRIISWNPNGIRALLKKNVLNSFLKKYNPDIVCFNEIKSSEFTLEFDYPFIYWNSSETKKGGYAGTLVLSKIKPDKVEMSPFDNEGRLIKLEFKSFTLINVYVPNAGQKLKRLDFRNEWDKNFRKYVKNNKKLIIAGDLNVAYDKNIDIWNPSYNDKPGTTKKERTNFKKLLELGFVDTFRNLHKNKIKYSYWSYLGRGREKNKGWRLDYFLVSKDIFKKIKNSDILDKIKGSDHAPIILDINI